MHLKARFPLPVFWSTSQGDIHAKTTLLQFHQGALALNFSPFSWKFNVVNAGKQFQSQCMPGNKRNLNTLKKFKEVNVSAFCLHLLKRLSSNAIYFQFCVTSHVLLCPLAACANLFFFPYLSQGKITKQTELLSCSLLSH